MKKVSEMVSKSMLFADFSEADAEMEKLVWTALAAAKRGLGRPETRRTAKKKRQIC
jgi:hypothetical protein